MFWILFVILFFSSITRTARTDLDFKVFYGAAQKFRQNSSEFYPSVEEGRGMFPYKYGPSFAIFLSPLTFFQEPQARKIWGVINAIAFVVAWFLSILFLQEHKIQIGWPAKILSLLCIVDVVTLNALQGNTNAILLAMITYVLMLRSH